MAESVEVGGSWWRSGGSCVSIGELSKENIVLDRNGVDGIPWCMDGWDDSGSGSGSGY